MRLLPSATLPLACVVLAACTTPPSASVQTGATQAAVAVPAEPTLHAGGRDPVWALELTATTISLWTDGGPLRAEAPTPTADNRGDTTVWRTVTSSGPLELTTTARTCTDGLPRPLSAQVTWQGRTLRGCGGNPGELLRGGAWQVEDINNGGVIDDSHVTLDFGDDGRLSGHATCNPYTGTWRTTPERLQLGRTAATIKACAPALMLQEERFLAVLAGTQRFELTADGALVLVATDGARLRARRR